MSVFGSIVSAIFGSKHAASVTAAAGSSAPPPSAGSAKGASAPSPSPSPAPAAGASPASAEASTVSATAAKTISKADVEAILAKLADDQDEDYDWKRSIVDLMKLLKLDSGLGARKQLAQELGYTGGLGGNERVAAQTGDDEARRERRQGAGQSQGIVRRKAAHVHHQLDYTWPDRWVHWKQNCQSTGPRFLARHRAGDYWRYCRSLSVRVFWRNGHHRSEHLEHDRRNCGLGRGALGLQCANGPPSVILRNGKSHP